MGRKAGGLNYPGYVFIRQTLLAFAGNSWAGMWGDHVVFLWSVVITSRKCLMFATKIMDLPCECLRCCTPGDVELFPCRPPDSY